MATKMQGKAKEGPRKGRGKGAREEATSGVTEDTPEKGWHLPWMATFLATLADSGNVKLSAYKAGITRLTAYRTRVRHSDFREAWEEAVAVAVEGQLEAEAIRRATEGVRRPVYYQGKRVGIVREYSDTLLIFLLKAHAPDKYMDKSATKNTQFNVDMSKLTDDQLQRVANGEDLFAVLATSGESEGEGAPSITGEG